MRFSYAESMCDPSHYLPLAIAAEQAGYTSFCVPDSIAYPRDSDSKYPYTPDGDRRFLEDRPFIEPFSLIPAMGAVTERLRFTTFVVKLPIRQPVLVAKSAASVAVLTGNRFGFGVGLSPWPEDYRICGQEWEARGARMDEMIEILRGLTKGSFFEFHGKHYDLPAVKICPVPTRPIPILIGGHSEAALRREYGRERDPFEVHVIALDAFTLDGVRRLQDLGVTDAIVGFRNAYEKDTQTLAQKTEALSRFAEAVIAKV